MSEGGVTIFVLSDGTGETADQMIKAALVQFRRDGLKIVRYKNVRTDSQVASIFEEALTVRATRDALAKLDANPERLLG